MVGKRNSPQGVWWRVAGIAEAQLGLIARQQLRELGMPDANIDDAVARGRLHRVFHGVFGVGHGPLGAHARLRAATMACGQGAVVSHGTAAWLLQLRHWQPLVVDVIAPVERGRKIGGVRRRFVPLPGPGEVEVRDGVPSTDPSRTIVDCAGILRRRGTEDLIEEAAALGVLDVPAIDAILDGPPRRGARTLLRLVEPWRRYEKGIVIRSRLEAKLLPLLTLHGLPTPETNAGLRLAGKRYEIDFLWRRQKVALEADSRRHHDNPAAGARDSRRNRALIQSGFAVLRLDWEDVRDRPVAAMAELRALLL